jgi:putative tryptophan/tyrosine transport system substrate-binding protein
MTAALALVLAASLAAGPALASKTPSVGIMYSPSPAAARAQDQAFGQGLRELGYVEGQNITIERRYADGDPNLLGGFATELARAKVDVIVAPSSTAALAVKKATTTIPIVFALANDPVGVGLVASLSRPGNNLTGLTPMSADLGAKRLELLKETVPDISRVAILSASSYPRPVRDAMIKELETAARLLRLDVRVAEVGRRQEFDAAFSAMANDKAALIVLPIPFLTNERRRVAELALRHRLPSVFHWKEYVEVGGLMSYGASQNDLVRRAAGYVDKILKGAKPGPDPRAHYSAVHPGPRDRGDRVNLSAAPSARSPAVHPILARRDRDRRP